jgi:hypothetical protein
VALEDAERGWELAEIVEGRANRWARTADEICDGRPPSWAAGADVGADGLFCSKN